MTVLELLIKLGDLQFQYPDYHVTKYEVMFLWSGTEIGTANVDDIEIQFNNELVVLSQKVQKS